MLPAPWIGRLEAGRVIGVLLVGLVPLLLALRRLRSLEPSAWIRAIVSVWLIFVARSESDLMMRAGWTAAVELGWRWCV